MFNFFFLLLGIMDDLKEQQAQPMVLEDLDDQTDWSQLAASSSQTPKSSGRKRKRVFRKFSPSNNKRKRKSAGSTGVKKKRGKVAVDPNRRPLAKKLGKSQSHFPLFSNTLTFGIDSRTFTAF